MEENKTMETTAGEEKEFLPLGSIVRVRGSVKKLMILSRGTFPMIRGAAAYHDYGVCAYPEGIIGDSLIYINHEDIQEIVFSGYRDEDEVLMQDNIRMAVRQMTGHPADPGAEPSAAENA